MNDWLAGTGHSGCREADINDAYSCRTRTPYLLRVSSGVELIWGLAAGVQTGWPTGTVDVLPVSQTRRREFRHQQRPQHGDPGVRGCRIQTSTNRRHHRHSAADPRRFHLTPCYWVFHLRFYVPLDTKWVISETFFAANFLARTAETKPNTAKASIHPKYKRTTV